MWSNVTEEMIAGADDDPPSISELAFPVMGYTLPGRVKP